VSAVPQCRFLRRRRHGRWWFASRGRQYSASFRTETLGRGRLAKFKIRRSASSSSTHCAQRDGARWQKNILRDMYSDILRRSRPASSRSTPRSATTMTRSVNVNPERLRRLRLTNRFVNVCRLFETADRGACAFNRAQQPRNALIGLLRIGRISEQSAAPRKASENCELAPSPPAPCDDRLSSPNRLFSVHHEHRFAAVATAPQKRFEVGGPRVTSLQSSTSRLFAAGAAFRARSIGDWREFGRGLEIAKHPSRAGQRLVSISQELKAARLRHGVDAGEFGPRLFPPGSRQGLLPLRVSSPLPNYRTVLETFA